MYFVENNTADEILNRYLELSETDLEKEQILLELSNQFDLTINKVNWILFNLEKEKLLDFWNLDEKQQKMINSWDEKFRNKMRWFLIFEGISTIFVINWRKIIFDNNVVVENNITWRDSSNNGDKFNKKLLDDTEIEDLINLFKWNISILNDILSLKGNKIWSSTAMKYYDLMDWKYYFKNTNGLPYNDIYTLYRN